MALAGRVEPAAAGPFTVEVEFDATHLPVAAAVVPTVEITAPRRVTYTNPTMYEAVRTFKAVTSLVSSAVEETYG